MMRASVLAVAVLVGCGGPREAREPEASTTIAPVASASDDSVPAPRVIPAEESALEACLAPIDPSVFAKLGGGGGSQPQKRRGSAPRRDPTPPAPIDSCPTNASQMECAYWEARNHFEERRFDLAAKGFRKIALEAEVTDEGLFAGQLALEAMNILGTQAEPPRPACFDLIGSDNDKLIERYCQKPLRADREESCFMFFRIARDVRRLHAEELVKTADRGPPNEPGPLYERAGDEYRALFDEGCDPKSKPPPDSTRCAELLFNAHRAYRSAGARTKMEAAYKTFFDPRFGLEKSPLAEKLGGD